MRALRAIAQQLDGNPRRARKMSVQPLGVRAHARTVTTLRRARRPQQQTVLRFEQRLDIRALQYITPLRRCAAGSSNQAAHLTVTPPVGGQHDEGQTAIEMKLRADDEARAASLQRGVGTYHPCHGTLVRQRERSVAQGLGAFSEFHGLRGTAQETEAAEAVQFGIGRRQHTVYLYSI